MRPGTMGASLWILKLILVILNQYFVVVLMISFLQRSCKRADRPVRIPRVSLEYPQLAVLQVSKKRSKEKLDGIFVGQVWPAAAFTVCGVIG